jgi:hypothetical protein
MRFVSTCCLRTLVVLTAATLAFSNAAAQAPANDECPGATLIGSLPFSASQDTRLATENANDPLLYCADGGKGKTVWFAYTAASTQYVTFSTVGSTPADYDVAMGLFTGTCGNLTIVACNDDVASGTVRQSEITFGVQAGTTYYVHIAEWNGGGPTGGTPTGGDLVFTAKVATNVPPVAKGPKSGSLASGVTVSTDPYGPESPFFKQTNIPPRVNRPSRYLPDPPNMIPPAAPAGSNYVEDRLDKPASAASRPVVLKHFQGVPDQGVRIPPDPDLAVGPNHIIGIVNSRFKIFDKEGTVLKTVEADQWYDPIAPGNWSPFDPQVIYDHFAGRWVMTWAHVQDTTSAKIFISVSDDADPLGTWYSWATPSNAIGDSAVPFWDDYPQLGYDADAIYVTGRMFTLNTSSRVYSRVRIFPKSSIYASPGGALSWFDLWDFRDPTDLNVAPDGIQATNTFGTPGVQFLMTDSPFTTGTYFSIWKIASPATAPSVTASFVPVTAFTTPPNAGQLGGGALAVEAGGRRIRSNPVYRDSSLWAVHSIASGTGGQYSAVRYVRINPFTNTLLEDAAMGAEGYWHYYTALMADQNSNIMVTFSRSGESEYIGAYVAGRKEGDGTGLSTSIPVKLGEENYVKDFNSGRNRWGDYNGIALDPLDNDAIWVHTEYAGRNNRWGNWIAKAKVGPLAGVYVQAEPTLIHYASVEEGTAGTTDTVVIINAGTNQLVVSSIVNPGPDFTYDGPALSLPIAVTSLETLRLPFRFTPTTGGNLVDSVVIVSNAANEPNLVIRLEGRGVSIAPAIPGIMYAVNGPTSPGLFSVDRVSGSATELGSIPSGEIHGLAVRTSNRTLYGTSVTADSTVLYRVSAATGETIPVSVIRVGNMRAIAFSPGDTLYGATTNGRLFRVNPATGDTALVGTAQGIVYASLAFDPATGVLWASIRPVLGSGKDRIFTVNTANGDTTLMGVTTLGSATPGIAFDAAGSLFAVAGTGANPSQLYQLNTSNANATLIGSTGVAGVNAIAIRTDSLTTSVGEEVAAEVPARFQLDQNYPNPFNPSTTIRYSVPVSSQVRLSVYNMLGQEVSALVDRTLPAGSYTSVWDGRTITGAPAATGLYLYKLQATRLDGAASGAKDSFVETRKMLLLK